MRKKAPKKGPTAKTPKYDFDVALSFAGEDRKYVNKVANRLVEMGYKPFYDSNETVSLWGKDLYEHLCKVYSETSKYTVMFISKHYSKKLWTNHERKSAQSRAFKENSEYILPVRFDKTQIPAVLPTTGYVDLSKITPNQLAEMIKQKLGPIIRKDFLPSDVDRLIDFMKIKSAKNKQRAHECVGSLFSKFKLMTHIERHILSVAAVYGCTGGPPEDVHIELPYFARLLKMKPDDVIQAISRISSLSFEFEVIKFKDTDKKRTALVEPIGHTVDVLHIKFFYNHSKSYYNASDIYSGVFHCFAENICPECVVNCSIDNDFSILSYVAGFPHRH